MSKFIDKLNRVFQAVPQPMGFRTALSAADKPGLMLVAGLTRADIGAQAGGIEGADAGLMPLSSLAADKQAVNAVMAALPWGVRLEGTGKDDISAAVAAGGDFLVFPATNTPAGLGKDCAKVGKILQVEPSLDIGMVRAINDLPVEAVLMADDAAEDDFVTWHQLMLFKRFVDLLSKPLLVPVPTAVGVGELQVLWELGVAGVVVEIKPGQHTTRLKELRRMIGDLTPPKRKRGRAEAILPPYIGGSVEPDIDDAD